MLLGSKGLTESQLSASQTSNAIPSGHRLKTISIQLTRRDKDEQGWPFEHGHTPQHVGGIMRRKRKRSKCMTDTGDVRLRFLVFSMAAFPETGL